MSPWVHLFALDLGVVGLALGLLLLDSFVRLPGRVLGLLVAGALTALFLASFGLSLDGATPDGVYVGGAWTLFLKRTLLASGILAVLGVMDWLETYTPGRRAEFYALLLFSLSGMMILPGVRDWVLMLVAFEVMGVPLAVLAAWAKQDGPHEPSEPRLAAEAGLKLFVISAASSAITFFGVALVTGLTGTTHITGVEAVAVTPLLAVGLLLVVGGFGFKIGAVPFHFWIADTYEGAPTPFVAFLSVAPKVGGLAALAVVLILGWGQHPEIWGPAIALIAGANMIVGNVFALPQQDTRRLLAFSGIAQIGYVLLALRAGTANAVGMLRCFRAAYVVTNLGGFLVVHAAAEQSHGHTTAKLTGLSRRAPGLGAALLVFLLSLAGIPFVAGFWAKVFVFLEAWRAGLLGLAVLGATVAVVGLFYYLSVARATFMADGDPAAAPIRVGFPLGLAIALCLLAVVGLGLYPGPLVEGAHRAAGAFLAGR